MRHSKDASLVLPIALVLLSAACALTACSDGAKNDAGNTQQPDAAQPAIDAGHGHDAGHDAGQVPPSCPDTGGTAPLDVFCIGLYDGHDAHKTVASAVPYTPGIKFWSDAAEKTRFFALPPGTQIDTSDMDAWKFPVGTKAFKEFRFDGKLVETRMVWKQAEHNTVYATYIWDATETNAPLNQSKTPVLLASGYEIPTARDCGKCHHGAVDKFLGLEAIELALPTTEGITLASLATGGLLTNPPQRTAIELPEDATGKAAGAIGYLHANCGMPCHSSRGLGDETQLLLRLSADWFWPPADADAGSDGNDGVVAVTETDTYKATIGEKPTTASVAQKFPDALRITPGNHEQSLLWLLSHRRGEYQMPPLVSHKIDEDGTQKLADWIDALSP